MAKKSSNKKQREKFDEIAYMVLEPVFAGTIDHMIKDLVQYGNRTTEKKIDIAKTNTNRKPARSTN